MGNAQTGNDPGGAVLVPSTMASAPDGRHALAVATATERIEDVRVAWERDLERDVALHSRGWRPSLADPGRSEPRVKLEPAMAERVHRVARDAADRLGCPDPFIIYQTPRAERHVNGQALVSEAPFAIRLIGPVASVLDDGALSVLIGHELGHWLALGPRARPPSGVGRAWEYGELDHLAEVCRRVESRGTPLFSSAHPSSAFRSYATWLFWRTELHKELTGKGPGDMAVRDVDRQLPAACDEASAREVVHRPADVRVQTVVHETPRAPPALHAARLPSFIELRAHAVASSVVSTVERLVAGVTRKPAAEAPP